MKKSLEEKFTVLDLSATKKKAKEFDIEGKVEKIKALAPSYKRRPWQHQLDAIDRAREQQNFALFFEMGTGKTFTMISILREKYFAKGKILKTLILCPPIVIENWKKEFRLSSSIADSVIPLRGTGKQRLDAFLLHTKEKKNEVIFVTNYQALLMESIYTHLVTWGPEIIVYDESHRLKNPFAKTSKLAMKLSTNAYHRYILTGTPVLNTPLDLFSQYKCLDTGIIFGKSFYEFRAKFFEDKNRFLPRHAYFPKWEPKPEAVERINRYIKTTSMTVKKEECLDLPPLVRETVFVELSPSQRRAYKQMKEEFISVFENNSVAVANLAITKALRLQQIVSGFIPTEGVESGEKSLQQFEDTPRGQALREILSDLCPGSKVLVWAVFRDNYETIRRVCEAEKLRYVEVHGEVSEKKKEEAVHLFNTDPSVSVFIGNPQSAGIGINLISASYSVFYSRSFSLEQDLQAEARNYRGGSEIHKKVTRIDLVAKDTIDELITESLAKKQALGEALLLDVVKKCLKER
jgi:SNF2 family DNA or RNA helicase